MDQEILQFALSGIRASIMELKNKERILEAQLVDTQRGVERPVRLSKNGKRLGRPPKIKLEVPRG